MEIKVDCPFCGKPKHMYVNMEKGVYHCFKCKEGGNLTGDLIKRLGKEGVLPSPKASLKPNDQVPKGLRLITKKDELHWNYAKKREALKYKKKLFISTNYPEYLTVGLPLLPTRTPPKFLFGRKLLLAGPRYRYFNKTYGVIAKSFRGKVEKGLVVEGFFDLCKAEEVLPTIALLGKDWDEEKVRKINKYITKKIYLCLDKDALKDVIQLCGMFPNREVKIVHTDVFKDPGQDVSWIESKVSRG